MTGADLAAAAAALAGTRFRLHGRDPATGIDCVGLLEAALKNCGSRTILPRGYTMRTARPERWIGNPAVYGFVEAAGSFQPGDVILLAVGPAQSHIAIAGPDQSWVHAHAGLRRVVVAPHRPEGRLTHHWRLSPQD